MFFFFYFNYSLQLQPCRNVNASVHMLCSKRLTFAFTFTLKQLQAFCLHNVVFLYSLFLLIWHKKSFKAISNKYKYVGKREDVVNIFQPILFLNFSIKVYFYMIFYRLIARSLNKFWLKFCTKVLNLETYILCTSMHVNFTNLCLSKTEKIPSVQNASFHDLTVFSPSLIPDVSAIQL